MRAVLPLRRRKASDDEGAVALEFVLVVPILLLLVFGIINFGVLFGQQLALNSAVREGARAAVVVGTATTTTGLVQDKVRGAVSAIAMDPSDVAVTTQYDSNTSPTVTTMVTGVCPNKGGGEDLYVKAKYTATPLIMWPIPGLNSFNLQADAVFRCEW